MRAVLDKTALSVLAQRQHVLDKAAPSGPVRLTPHGLGRLSRTAPCKLEEGLSTIDRTAPGPSRSSVSEVVMLTHFQQSPNGCLEISGTYRAISRLGENGTPWSLAAA